MATAKKSETQPSVSVYVSIWLDAQNKPRAFGVGETAKEAKTLGFKAAQKFERKEENPELPTFKNVRVDVPLG